MAMKLRPFYQSLWDIYNYINEWVERHLSKWLTLWSFLQISNLFCCMVFFWGFLGSVLCIFSLVLSFCQLRLSGLLQCFTTVCYCKLLWFFFCVCVLYTFKFKNHFCLIEKYFWKNWKRKWDHTSLVTVIY